MFSNSTVNGSTTPELFTIAITSFVSTLPASCPINFCGGFSIIYGFVLFNPETEIAVIVSDIIKKSGIARPTFYRHYKSKDDVILQFLENCFAPTEGEPPHEAHEYANKGYIYLMSLSLENYVRHGAALKIILNSEAEYLVFQYIKKWESHVLDLYKNTLTPQEYIYLRYTVLFSIAGSAQIICDWIKNDMPIPAERLIEWIREKDKAVVC
ncbi:MAG: TetR/AcrR family transcriptional regulator [Spirochaetales bacterium]|nr:TetR/AcrR family transcriptional regulator [Spirochaetales bacterium]